MSQVNPEILSWARETAGLSPEDTVKKLGIKDAWGVAAIERLAALENGEVPPTRAMLSKMAKKYRRPLLTFYLAQPPRRGNWGQRLPCADDGPFPRGRSGVECSGSERPGPSGTPSGGNAGRR